MNHKLSALVVHDNPDGVDLTMHDLRRAAPSTFRIRFASGVSEALAALKKSAIDVVLLDMGLSGSKGMDALRGLVGFAPKVPVVVLTSQKDEGAGEAAIQEGAEDCLVKEPFPGRFLWKALRIVVARRRLREVVRRSDRFAQAVLDGMSDNIAILDESGKILMVNRAWREFARANLGAEAHVCEGANYLAVCDTATGASSEGAGEMAAAIRAVIAGRQPTFAMEYPCHSPDEERWFVAQVNPLSGDGPHRAVIAHKNVTERKQAEEKLRISEKVYRSIVEDQTEVICRFRADGTIIYANDVYARLFGKRPEALIGKKWQALAFHEDVAHIEAQLAGLSPSNPVVVIENRVFSATGETRWMQFVNRAIYDEDSQLTELQAVGRDITERKRVEQELHRSQTELLAVYEHAPFMLCLLDGERRIVFANHSFLSYEGMPREGCFFKIASGVLGCCAAQNDLCGAVRGRDECETCKLRYAIAHTFETGESHHNVEHTIRILQQGKWREVTWLASTARISAEGGLRVLLALQDITEYRKAETELRVSEARLRALYENSLVGILFTSPDGRVFNANPAARRLLGRTEAEIRRLGRSGLLDQEDPNLPLLMAERASTGTVQGMLTYIRGDGTRFPADTASVVFDTPEGPRTCTIIQDVSERESAAERIRDFSRRVLSIREEEKHGLSAALHHDVGSMSVGVGARLQAAEEDLRAGKPQEASGHLKEGRQLFDEAVQRLKALAMELRPPDLDILGLPVALRQHFAQVRRIAPFRITFTDATHDAIIEPDVETDLFRVAQECLNNIMKHAEASQVLVRLAVGKKGIRLTIADDGVGFNPVLVLDGPGGGMGLRAVREMVRAHGGELVTHSIPGKGTRIVAIFPLERTGT